MCAGSDGLRPQTWTPRFPAAALGRMSTKDQPASFLLGIRAAARMMEIIIDPTAR
jgi:hypothetical protein